MIDQTRELFRGYVAIANAAVAGVDDDFEDGLNDQLFYIGDELRRRLADDFTDEAIAMIAVINAREKGALAPREIARADVGTQLGDDYRKIVLAAIDRAPEVRDIVAA